MNINDITNVIKDTGRSMEKAAMDKIDGKTKPAGSLGTLELIAVKMCMIRNSLTPNAENKALFVFAGDHGITREGVSAYPQEVTSQMVMNFMRGGAAINVLCRQGLIGLHVIDMGVNHVFGKDAGITVRKIAMGTKNFLMEAAMERPEAEESVLAGYEIVDERIRKDGLEIIGVGDMGIGNTASSSAIISAALGIGAEETTWRGTGIDDESLKKKIRVIDESIKLHGPDPADAIDILSKVGGFEIGGMAGGVLAAAANGIPVVLDGIISCAAGLLANILDPRSSGYMFAAHRSVEKGQAHALGALGLVPILDLGMRLGEGTGAALAMGIIDASCRIMTEMASFSEAGVSGKK
ncbi:MAG: nicotinate-nucleotide--dimethylbenzimidazole phosphoribosyltransferase [Spirochaetes bacterium]|jgi:nicotinate-nucleotide--dimethylbenzimidazole phosphoribosyltransferase|nr:nicotinate-nucleotide--dimethylbenzimidazole phosphoribosyltransferase [Spirochaetota bacterium]